MESQRPGTAFRMPPWPNYAFETSDMIIVRLKESTENTSQTQGLTTPLLLLEPLVGLDSQTDASTIPGDSYHSCNYYQLDKIEDGHQHEGVEHNTPSEDTGLPKGETTDLSESKLVLDFGLATYRFDRYKSSSRKTTDETDKFGDKQSTQTPTAHQSLSPGIKLVSDALSSEEQVLLDSTYWIQDMISTPARDFTPVILQETAETWASEHSDRVKINTVIGEDLLSFNGPIADGQGCGMIYAVGQGAMHNVDRQPRLIHLRYDPPEEATQGHEDNSKDPKEKSVGGCIHLVGKGVTYDTGGLNLKPGKSMLYMRKDMGGAAHALGLMRSLVECCFPLPLELWLPAVENVLGADSFRPGDVITGVTGKTTEIGNTDAEGRLVMSDALCMASANKDCLAVFDFATLTGAARVALGPDVPAVFTNRPDDFMTRLREAAVSERDPLWELPLWNGYRPLLDSKLADLNNVSDTALAGAITAALYLQEFVRIGVPWMHMDLYGLNDKTKHGRAQGFRAMHRFLLDMYGRRH